VGANIALANRHGAQSGSSGCGKAEFRALVERAVGKARVYRDDELQPSYRTPGRSHRTDELPRLTADGAVLKPEAAIALELAEDEPS
jgi:hypothetical protein